MRKKLLIVESECKAKTLKSFLDADFEVVTCYGHVRTLPEKEIGITVSDDDVQVKFISPEKSKRTMEFLKGKAEHADKVYLAFDPDYEGEFRAFHLQKNLAKDKNDCIRFQRLRFPELTEKAVKEALEDSAKINPNWVAAHLTRKVFDRLMGYKVTPVIAKEFGKGVPYNLRQMTVLKEIVNREKEIIDFSPMEYSEITAEFGGQIFKLYFGERGNASRLKKKDAAEVFDIISVKNALDISKVEYIHQEYEPPQPFHTGSLIEAAYKVLNLPPEETMRAAKKLYEMGYITYIYTSTPYVSKRAVDMAHEHIIKKYGIESAGEDNSGKAIKPEGECIRPTKLVSGMNLVDPERSLLQLISKRFIASQMKACKVTYQVIHANNPALDYAAKKNKRYQNMSFKCIHPEVSFHGYRQLLKPEDVEYKMIEIKEDVFSEVSAETTFTEGKFILSSNQTLPADRFTEGSLVGKMQRLGVGYPSTIIATLKAVKTFEYVELDGPYLRLTERGNQINSFIEERFADLIAPRYARNQELQMKLIAGGEKWKPYVIDFDRKLEDLMETVAE